MVFGNGRLIGAAVRVRMSRRLAQEREIYRIKRQAKKEGRERWKREAWQRRVKSARRKGYSAGYRKKKWF